MTVGYGVLTPVDGPPPTPPRYSLLSAARIVPVTDDRWINGTAQHPYAKTGMGLWDPCLNASSAGHSKAAGTPTGEVDQGSFAGYAAGTCTAVGIGTEQEFRARIQAIYAARESLLVEAEFWDGALIPDNPHLTGPAAYPPTVIGAQTNPVNGLALLEQAIGATGEQGMIHCTPAMLVAWSAALGGYLQERAGKLVTPNGNIVVPGGGYSGNGPTGTPAAGTVEWAYATGNVEIRESDIFIMPDTLAQALDRQHNMVTYRAERYYNIVWSRLVHAAVKIDRCQIACAAG